ncbi:cellulose biosynthesis protein BcsO [Dickeya dadantii]|uniref:cellulose biosynthesis protein BcsO n=1 Tax=Dickeya dadantii TaxID=204038 RepID=UPI001EF197F7|nr:cellulose biosynthesis protein BcsO [Dickeya dadantii]
MQRFKDKAQIKDINFRDMSGQVLQSETAVWPIMKQLLRNQTGDDTLSGAQPVSIAQPVPVSQHVLSAPASSPRRVTPSSSLSLNADPSGGNQHSLFNAIAASLPPAEAVSAPTPQPIAPPAPVSQPQPAALAMETAPPATARPHPLASAPAVSEANAASEAGRFRPLFSRRHHDEIHSVSKTMSLKPLLEKIALCR